jgi:hypothetical protein
LITAIVRFALCALLPPVEGLPGLVDTNVTAFVREILHDSTWIYWLGLVGGCVLFVVAPVITIGVPLPAFLLPKATLDRYADRVAYHPLYPVRSAIFLIKMSAGMGWGRDPHWRQALQLPPLGREPGTWRTS